MNKKFIWGLVFLAIASTVSCASYFTRKDCEKVNWFQHAYDVAMNGKRLPEDQRLSECEKADTEINSAELDRGFKSGMENYCKPETALAKGTNGDTFNYDFCDSYQAPRLKSQFIIGLNKFCTPDTAYFFASSGGIYKNQCPSHLEKAYQARYRMGRQVYLKNEVTKAAAQIAELDGEIRDHQNQRNQLNHRIANLPDRTVQTKTSTYDPATKTYVEKVENTEDPTIRSEREDLEYSLNLQINALAEKSENQRRLRANVLNFNAELETLKN